MNLSDEQTEESAFGIENKVITKGPQNCSSQASLSTFPGMRELCLHPLLHRMPFPVPTRIL